MERIAVLPNPLFTKKTKNTIINCPVFAVYWHDQAMRKRRV